jgi:pimeloyl-ACP methyl ester carboxylesterase
MVHSGKFQEESLWFGSADHPLFGRLTTPAIGTALGGVLISSPIGRESRLARRALRTLAIYLALDGYVSLRYDHFGTGDSSGTIEDEELGRSWIDGVNQGTELLRSLGISSLSSVGMRMGATIVGAAASAKDLELTSFVMWDPCESGRTYVRELRALGALRRNSNTFGLGEPTVMLEYPLSDQVARRLDEFNLSEPVSRPPAQRVLIVARDDRAFLPQFLAQWDQERADWTSTSEQGPLLETELPESVQPEQTIQTIRTWLTTAESRPTSYSRPTRSRDVVIEEEPERFAVRESVLDVGHRGIFCVVSEPVSGAQGPLIVLVSGINEDHVGPSRLWVELSRRWAGMGLQCVRFDFSELGESSWSPGQPDRPLFDRNQRNEIGEVVRALTTSDPKESVLIGLCSGAQVALEAALQLKSRALYAINPQVGVGVLRSQYRLRRSQRESVRSSTKRFEGILKKHPRVDDLIQQISRLVLLSAFSPRVRSALAENNSEMVLLLGPNDISPFTRIPIIGSLVGPQLITSEQIDSVIIPGLDHDFLSVLGRTRTVAILDRRITERFIGAAVHSGT